MPCNAGAAGIPDDHTVLVLYGDVPLIRTETLRELLALVGCEEHGAAQREVRRPAAATAASSAMRAAR